MSEQGMRLNISPATLCEWRREFARHFRDQGIAANATESAVRGETRSHKTDGMYRATFRGDSTHTRAPHGGRRRRNPKGDLRVIPGKSTLIETRKQIERGWRATADIPITQGHPQLAARVRDFLSQMPPPRTEKEQVAAALLDKASVGKTIIAPLTPEPGQ